MKKNVYQRIEDIRLEKDQTYESLSVEIDVTRATLHNILNGRTVPNARNRYKIKIWLDKQAKKRR